EWKGRGRKYYRGTRRTIERSIRNIKLQNNDYTRLKYMGNQQQLLQMKKERILNKARSETYKSQISSASSQYQKRRLKKEMVSAIRKNEGNWIKRIKNQIFVRKKSLGQRVRMTKRIATTVMSSLTLLLILMALLGIGTIILVALTEGAAQYVEMAVTMNDYGTLSESTAYLKKQETDLEEYLQNKPELEAELEANYGPDLYEFHYALADMGFSSTTLMAYLSAKYGSFNLDRVEAEIDSIFQEMYTLEIQIIEELREVIYTNPDTGEQMVVEEPRKICYVTLSKKELEEVIADRMDGEEKIRYSDYKLSSGGQQVYSPIMLEDWTNLISSDYGERIHPITGVRTFHNGVDIAIPTGTKLYSAVTGTVTVAQYSESAGNYVRVQTDSGWVVTFMHMDTLAVSPGQTVEKGDFLGHSGNTGRSTGPHLHLEVRDANNNPINPIFIVPQNCYQQEENDT
ncbi:MAG: M23 family metallopeptidase, partial [Lachnospiraceae bacterium]|nr:M23 family metallopeptidase [Lachnospiraceae bacterium]